MNKAKPHSLTRRERQIMDVLYKLERATVGQVLAKLADKPSYSTVRAQLRVLEEKGHVRHEEHGLRYVYIPAVPRDVPLFVTWWRRSSRGLRKAPSPPSWAAKFRESPRKNWIVSPASSRKVERRANHDSARRRPTGTWIPVRLHR